MIRASDLKYSDLTNIKDWWAAKERYDYGFKSRTEAGFSRRNKHEAYIAYHRLEDPFYRAGFQEAEIKARKENAWDFEKMTEEESRF